MPANVALRKGLGTAFNVLSRQFAPDVTIKLLSVSEDYDEFDEILTITSKRFFEYSNFRKNFLLEIADDNETLTEKVNAATHVGIYDADGNRTVYAIIAGDTKPPSSTDVTWKIYCDLFERNDARYADL